VIHDVRVSRRPYLVQAASPCWASYQRGKKRIYRSQEDLDQQSVLDPIRLLRARLLTLGLEERELQEMERTHPCRCGAIRGGRCIPRARSVHRGRSCLCPTPVTEERGVRSPAGGRKVPMVDAALFAIREIMQAHPEALLYGQDVAAAWAASSARRPRLPSSSGITGYSTRPSRKPISSARR